MNHAFLAALAMFTIGVLVQLLPGASLERVAVPKGSELEKDLGWTIAVTHNEPASGLARTMTFQLRARRISRLKHLSRIILLVPEGNKLAARVPLELRENKAAEIECHFQLSRSLASRGTLELICPMPDMPNGTIYEIKLSDHLVSENDNSAGGKPPR